MKTKAMERFLNDPDYAESALELRECGEEYREFLRSGLFHVTTANGFRGICRDRAILANDGSRPSIWYQSKSSLATKRGYVSLFDFGSQTVRSCLDVITQWSTVMANYHPAILLKLSFETLEDKLVSNDRADVSRGSFIPYVEVWYPSRIPWKAIELCAMAWPSLRPVPCFEFDGSLQILRTIEEKTHLELESRKGLPTEDQELIEIVASGYNKATGSNVPTLPAESYKRIAFEIAREFGMKSISLETQEE